MAPRLPDVLRPFPAPRLTQLAQFQGDYADRMLWGTYRPGFYFGARRRSRWDALLLCACGTSPPLGQARAPAQLFP